jgi:hypothetical protein
MPASREQLAQLAPQVLLVEQVRATQERQVSQAPQVRQEAQVPLDLLDQRAL